MTHPTTVASSTSRTLIPASGVVLGFGAALDCEIRWDASVLSDLARSYGVVPDELVGQRPICSERDLVVSIMGYFTRSAGGERRVDEPQVIEEFCARFDRVASIGGTCVRAAAAMLRLGQQATVHLAFESDQVLGLLPPGTQALVPDVDLPSYPHLVVQYPAGARVVTDRLELVATRANRLIYVNDPANEEIALSPALPSAVAGAAVFLVSGFNAMRNLPALRARLDVVEAAVVQRRASGTEGVVMYEDAGFHQPEFAEVVRSRMARVVDVYSLSDEELVDAVAASGALDLLDADAVLAAVSTLAARLGVPTVVVHSRHWALAFGPTAGRYRDALATGTALATARYAHGELVTHDHITSVAGASPDPAAVAFARRIREIAGEQVTVVAVPTLEVPDPTTVGLGDTFVGGFLAACARLVDEQSHPAAAGKAP
ncbi:hypothetical protein ASD62_14070 [Phycicoccus sp. Root563]|uniref:ADP-dependent glucokinase/phosphofructokinase n=1 Tax=Phycicoccus sp. Root563 TaxID=1736562 RepID=UPI0007027DFB|nr:ADP-dependent glucokinase/phosphofructokinase [Phycicoccus sp. Root563]KQZ90249.1 hypothetical protein ASD62_14070 [Phycicoccus sp. Root563]